MIERVTGFRPAECPWRAFEDPIVSEVLDAYRWFESGQLAIQLGNDPPAILVEAIGVYHGALNRVWSHDRRNKSSG